jgi:hypothetical protein
MNLLAQVSSGTSSSSDAVAGFIGLIFLFFRFSICVLLWLLPGFIVNIRKHHNRGAIWAVTLLCGWTFVGWVIALVWAFTNPPPPAPALTSSEME